MRKEYALHHEQVEHLITGIPEELQSYPHFVVWKLLNKTSKHKREMS